MCLVGGTLQEARDRKARNHRAAEESHRILPSEVSQPIHEISDAALAKRAGALFEPRCRAVHELGGFGHLILELVGGVVHGFRHVIDLLRTGLLLLFRDLLRFLDRV